MAVDAGLMARARATGESTLRMYGWRRPTLSFGRHESVRARFSPETLERHGVDAVRRPTGGRVLLHEGEVTYSVTAPAADGESVREGFARINHLLMAALARLGVHVGEAPHGRPLRPGRDACFAEPSAGELVVDGRKLVASAQRRDSGALLQHGSILLSDCQHRITAFASVPMSAPAPAATLELALGRVVGRDEVRDALRAALEAEVGEVRSLDAGEAAEHARPFLTRYADPEWTWRR
jgi:lipoate-protein ligase A